MRRGTRVGQAYVAITADGSGINEEIVDSVDGAGPGVEKAGDEQGRRFGDRFSDRFRERLDGMREKVANRLSSQMGDAGDDAGKHFSKNFEDHFDNDFLDRLGGRVGSHMVDAINHALGKEGGENPLSKLFDRWMTEAVSGNGRNGKNNKGGIGDLVGRMFGAGSRNNFLNVFGKSLGGIVSMVENAGKFAGTFADNMAKAGEGANLFQKLGAGFSGGGAEGAGMLSKIAASGPAAAAAIGSVTVAMALMVSIAGALIALVTALAATIVSGLVGALAVLGGGILAVVAAGGLLTAAFMSMTDAQQALLKNAFRPLKAEMVGIGQIMLQDMVPAFSTWSANLQKALMLAVPVAHVMGKAFADAGNILTASFSGPGFQALSAALTTYLPSIITRLSSALGGFLNGALGMFAALMPYVNQFAGYLANVAARFSAWANSAQGQNSIVGFAARAVASLQSLWNFVASFAGFLARVLFSPEAQNAGNTIFDGLARTFENFTNKIAQAQANGSLKKWFDDAIQFGSQLWSVIEALGGTFMSLYNSGVLDAVGKALGTLALVIKAANTFLGPLIDALGKGLPLAMQGTLAPLNATANAIIAIGNALEWTAQKIGIAQQKIQIGTAVPTDKGISDLLGQTVGMTGKQLLATGKPKAPTFSMPQIQQSGLNALNATSIGSGGYKPKPMKPKYKNPYVKWANSLIKQGPSVSAQIKNAVLSVNKAAASGIAEAAKSTSSGDVASSMDSLMSSITTTGEQTVNTARSALNSAATSLANATSKGAAKSALKKVKASQKDLQAALANQKRIQNAASILNSQKVVSEGNVQALLSGLFNTNATLADYAEARSRVADALQDANQKLQDAISLRDQYNSQVADSIKSFGSLLTAQAQTLDGVEQALTSGDITSNLQDKLTQIKKFQEDLRLLLAQGLSNDAYKQIVDAGVEQGTTIADALLSGGNGAIQNVNSLVGQINGIADTLGSETSSRLYQAGVDAAQGLVDGLTSLSAQLDAAAYNLGNSIALAVKKALGIASPSRVLRSMMGDVGDGAVLGLNDQHVKVGTAASALASKIAVNPGGGSYPSSSTAAGVSGNPAAQVDLTIVTPTQDPHAVANEVINELVGRL